MLNKPSEPKRKFRVEGQDLVFDFGKFRDQSLEKVARKPSGRSYLEWMAKNEFHPHDRAIAWQLAIDPLFPIFKITKWYGQDDGHTDVARPLISSGVGTRNP